MTLNILILNGPNLNMLGTREPHVYGHQTLDDLDRYCIQQAEDMGIKCQCLQSNHEGELVEKIQKADQKFDGIIINAAAYTHTSIALHDALKLCSLPFIEVHLSNIYARDTFRHKSLIAPLAKGTLCGFGQMGYSLALQAIKEHLENNSMKG